eukprot:GHVR01140256.1.p1 GENE.GHVR01140256.1~~GHVR01140256.1.p1  ORF type:complete len:308 (-),score=72.39 GHVR01140256.1:61-984(-)
MCVYNKDIKTTIEEINKYSKECHGGVVTCVYDDDKGRVLYSNNTFSPGDVIFIQPPLHVVQERKGDVEFLRLRQLCRNSDYCFDPLWYWCAFNSLLTQEDPPNVLTDGYKWTRVDRRTQQRLLMLYTPTCNEASEDTRNILAALGLEEVVNHILFEKLLQVWIHNCFEYSDAPLGYSVYYTCSFLSHCCNPNTVWHYDQFNNFVLRARIPIVSGDELSVSYLSEEGLLDATHRRMKILYSTKSFKCTCDRCTSSVDLSRGFLCPSCKKLPIFLSPTAGTEDDSDRYLTPSKSCSHADSLTHTHTHTH